VKPFNVQKKRKTVYRKPLKYTHDQLRLKIKRYNGESRTIKRRKIVKGTLRKSTKICLKDLSSLSFVDYQVLINFCNCKGKLWYSQAKRLIEIVDLCDSGRVVKLQSKVCKIYDEPQLPPVREMRVDVFGGRILNGINVPQAEKPMPSFSKLFKIG